MSACAHAVSLTQYCVTCGTDLRPCDMCGQPKPQSRYHTTRDCFDFTRAELVKVTAEKCAAIRDGKRIESERNSETRRAEGAERRAGELTKSNGALREALASAMATGHHADRCAGRYRDGASCDCWRRKALAALG